MMVFPSVIANVIASVSKQSINNKEMFFEILKGFNVNSPGWNPG